MKTTNDKEEAIRDLLANSVYQSDSGLVCRLRKALSRLSREDVADLCLLVQIKIEHQEREMERDKDDEIGELEERLKEAEDFVVKHQPQLPSW